MVTEFVDQPNATLIGRTSVHIERFTRGFMRRNPTSEGRIPVRSFVSLVGALAVALVSGSAAVAQEKLSVRLDFLPYGAHAPFYLAQEKGWFKENGVDPTIEDGTGTTTTVQLVGAGKYDLGYAGFVSAVVAREKGVPVKAVAGVLRKSDLGIVVDEKGSIFKPKDLEGKKIYFSPASVETLFMDSYFKAAGVDKSKVDLTSIDISAKVSTYLGGGGDGMFVPVPIYTIRKNIPRLSRGTAVHRCWSALAGCRSDRQRDGYQGKAEGDCRLRRCAAEGLGRCPGRIDDRRGGPGVVEAPSQGQARS